MKPNYQRFIDLIRVVEKVPPEKFDMHECQNCAAGHFFGTWRFSTQRCMENLNISASEADHLFAKSFDYKTPSGVAGKSEFFRRIREVLGLPKATA